MKTKSDPRHQKRRIIVKNLFSCLFYPQQPQFAETKEILAKKNEIDQEILASAPEWPIERINKIDLAILRLAIFELLFKKTAPPKVVIDEAVELAKEFGSENSPSFVNGVLGTVFNKVYSPENE